MTKVEVLTSVTDTLGVVPECPDVRHLTDEDVTEVSGGPEVVNTGNEA